MDKNTFFLSNLQVANRLGKWYFLLRPVDPADRCKYTESSPATLPPEDHNLEVNYTMVMYQSRCSFKQSGVQQWGGSGCEVGEGL